MTAEELFWRIVPVAVAASIAVYIAYRNGAFHRARVSVALCGPDYMTPEPPRNPSLVTFGLHGGRQDLYFVALPICVVSRGAKAVKGGWLQLSLPRSMSPEGSDVVTLKPVDVPGRSLRRVNERIFIEYDLDLIRPDDTFVIRECLIIRGSDCDDALTPLASPDVARPAAPEDEYNSSVVYHSRAENTRQMRGSVAIKACFTDSMSDLEQKTARVLEARTLAHAPKRMRRYKALWSAALKRPVYWQRAFLSRPKFGLEGANVRVDVMLRGQDGGEQNTADSGTYIKRPL